MDEPTEEERLKFVKSYGVEPVTDINTDLTFKDAATAVAEMTPIIGDAIAAKEVYDELMKEDPNYGLIAALGGAALVGAVPGIGDAAAAGIRKAVDVAKRVEVDPDAVGMMGGNIRIKPKVEEGTPTVEAAGLTDEAIETWRKENATSDEFRKSLKGRNETLQEAAAGVEEGRVFTSTYRKLADDLRPIRKVTEVPKPATFVEAVSALNAGKRKKPMIGLNASIPDGDVVTARLDIDAYTDYDIWVPTLTHPELKTVYKPAVVLEDVKFIQPEGREPKKALSVAKGGAKAPFAVMTGKYVEATDDEAYKLAQDVFDNPEFTQVGYDPTRRGFFYDRETGEAVVEADTVVQVGHLVLARNAKKMDAEAFPFNEGGMAIEEQMEMNFGDVPDNTIGQDPVSGNDIPMGSTAENVRDDIPAMLSEGEIVVPADVVNYHGVKLFEDLRDEAKLGYAEMAEDGRMGGQPIEDDMEMVGLDLADLEIMEVPDEPVEMRRGGMNFERGRGSIYRSYSAPKSSPRPQRTSPSTARANKQAASSRYTVVQKAPNPFSSPSVQSSSPAQPSYTASSTTGSYTPSMLGITAPTTSGPKRPTLQSQPSTRDDVYPSIGDQINFGGKGLELRQQDQAQREKAERRAAYERRRAEANQPSFAQTAVQKLRDITGFNPFNREDNQEDKQNNLFSSDRRGGQYPNIPEGTNLLQQEGFIPRFKQGLANTFGYDEGGMATNDNLIGGTDQFNQPFYDPDQKGGFNMDAIMPEGYGGSSEPLLEMREYMNDQGHRIFVTFIDGVPQMEIPEGYYPVGEPTTMQPAGVTGATMGTTMTPSYVAPATNDDPGVKDMAMPDGINYKELSLEELTDMVNSQSDLQDKAIATGVGALNPVMGAVVRFALWNQTRQVKKEIERRMQSDDVSEVDKIRYTNLLELANRQEPTLVDRLLGRGFEKTVSQIPKPVTPDVDYSDPTLAPDQGIAKPYTPDVQTANNKTTPGVTVTGYDPIPPVRSGFGGMGIDPAEEFGGSQTRFDPSTVDSTPAPKTSTTPITQASPRVQQARKGTQEVLQNMRDRGASREERTESLKAAARTENVLRDLDRGVVRGFDEGGLVEEPAVKKVVKGLKKASKSHAKQADQLEKALKASKKKKKSK